MAEKPNDEFVVLKMIKKGYSYDSNGKKNGRIYGYLILCLTTQKFTVEYADNKKYFKVGEHYYTGDRSFVNYYLRGI